MEEHIKEVVTEDGSIVKIVIAADLDRQIEIVKGLVETLEMDPNIMDVNTVTPEMARAVIRTSANGKLYLKNSAGESEVNLEMANETLLSIVAAVFGLGPDGSSIDTGSSDDDWEDPHEDSAQSGESYEDVSDRGTTRSRDADDEVTIMPEFTKQKANYFEPSEGENVHWDCKDCVHYIGAPNVDSDFGDKGRCKMVKGEIDPDGHCQGLYADVGFFGRVEDGSFKMALAAWGDMFERRISGINIEDVGDTVKAAIRRKM